MDGQELRTRKMWMWRMMRRKVWKMRTRKMWKVKKLWKMGMGKMQTKEMGRGSVCWEWFEVRK